MGLVDFGFNFSKTNASSRLNRDDTSWMYDQQSQHWRDNTTWFNTNGYSLLRQGLEKAGYNPLMALGATPQSGATVSGSAMEDMSQTTGLSASGLPLNPTAYRAQMRNLNADSLLKSAQTDETISRTNLQNAETVLENAKIPYATRRAAAETIGIETENRLNEEKIKNIEADTGLKISQKELTDIQGYYYTAMSSLAYSQRDYYYSLISKVANDLTLSSADRIWIQKHPKQAQLLKYVDKYGDAFHTIIKGVRVNRYDNYNFDL